MTGTDQATTEDFAPAGPRHLHGVWSDNVFNDGSFAGFEQAMIRERVLAGARASEEQGTSLGCRRLENCDAASVSAIKRAGGAADR